MVYRWVDHPAEVELQIAAATEAAVFEQALVALGELVGETTSSEVTSFDVDVMAPDRATLLAEWLGELAYLPPPSLRRR